MLCSRHGDKPVKFDTYLVTPPDLVAWKKYDQDRRRSSYRLDSVWVERHNVQVRLGDIDVSQESENVRMLISFSGSWIGLDKQLSTATMNSPISLALYSAFICYERWSSQGKDTQGIASIEQRRSWFVGNQ